MRLLVVRSKPNGVPIVFSWNPGFRKADKRIVDRLNTRKLIQDMIVLQKSIGFFKTGLKFSKLVCKEREATVIVVEMAEA